MRTAKADSLLDAAGEVRLWEHLSIMDCWTGLLSKSRRNKNIEQNIILLFGGAATAYVKMARAFGLGSAAESQNRLSRFP